GREVSLDLIEHDRQYYTGPRRRRPRVRRVYREDRGRRQGGRDRHYYTPDPAVGAGGKPRRLSLRGAHRGGAQRGGQAAKGRAAGPDRGGGALRLGAQSGDRRARRAGGER